ncbi:hypothetical protein GE061_017464 [Apolygus lucorum]|uniref:Uncharacterized protein n=1 Tax=Apolygus lucorum TaxID=248454 RepID=A0A8S9XF49_APOLU|nr:hypothetical protein GE061_017464 [Apolygus lucorum]
MLGVKETAKGDGVEITPIPPKSRNGKNYCFVDINHLKPTAAKEKLVQGSNEVIASSSLRRCASFFAVFSSNFKNADCRREKKVKWKRAAHAFGVNE